MIIGLDIAGIDFIAPDISKSVRETGGGIIEVNAAPGFRMHIEPSEGAPRDVARPVIDMLFPRGSRTPGADHRDHRHQRQVDHRRADGEACPALHRLHRRADLDERRLRQRRPVSEGDATGPRSAPWCFAIRRWRWRCWRPRAAACCAKASPSTAISARASTSRRPSRPQGHRDGRGPGRGQVADRRDGAAATALRAQRRRSADREDGAARGRADHLVLAEGRRRTCRLPAPPYRGWRPWPWCASRARRAAPSSSTTAGLREIVMKAGDIPATLHGMATFNIANALPPSRSASRTTCRSSPSAAR
jgi:hypothetical protein